VGSNAFSEIGRCSENSIQLTQLALQDNDCLPAGNIDSLTRLDLDIERRPVVTEFPCPFLDETAQSQQRDGHGPIHRGLVPGYD
jgi:hypothetical protein